MAISDAARKQRRPPSTAPQPGAIVVHPATGGKQPVAYPRCACGSVGALHQRVATTPEDARDACRAAATAGGWRFPDPGPDTVAYCPACVLEEQDRPPTDLTSAPSPPPDTAVPVTRSAPRGFRLAPHLQTLTTLPAPRYVINQVYDIPVGDLMPDPHQPRKLFDPAALRTLGASMHTGGQQHPIRFRERLNPPPEEAPLILVDGERRWRAAQLVGLPTLRAILDPDTDYGADLIVRQALLNEPGRPLQAWDWVLTFNHLARQYTLTPAQIAVHLTTRGLLHHDGRPWTRPQVANYLRLLALPGWCQDLIAESPLTPSHGLRILPHIARLAVMERLRTILGKRCAGTPSPTPAPADDRDEDLDAEATSGAATVNNDAPNPFTVADLRRELHGIYYELYIPLPDGKWLNNTLLSPQWNCEDPADQCRTCPQRAETDGWSGRKSWCMDQACMVTRNAEHQHHAAQTLDPAEAADRIARPDRDAREAEFEARQAQAQTECDAIRAAVSLAEPEQLLALLLWRLLSYHARSSGTTNSIPAPAAIAQHLAGHTRTRFLRARIAGLLNLNYDGPVRAVVQEYLGLAASPAEQPQDQEAP
ncbi:ParB/RepB/Spo0J family partition protein [uncultured Lamprocystis sp.]|jgi:ParB/RepB/Spo0J family partition protein|uniref:ParB/RepB/Spo0J family partition protein n=1 Tax=uncultured Lamprocystis sp. TaxID=543132 RepID=UPI0025E65B6F|nr:ParB/RepB/Spo0J family partition protein [uncultured Lamprocystis sp.]